MARITDVASAKAWLETQGHQVQVWFAARCALRALPGLGAWDGATNSGLAFASLRATLISAAAATCPAAEMKGLMDAARSAPLAADSAAAPLAADSAARSTADSAVLAARSAARSAFADALSARSADSAARSTAYSAVRSAFADSADSAEASVYYAVYSPALSAVYSAASWDSDAPGQWAGLWGDIKLPDGFRQGWEALKRQWEEDAADWSFWVAWYERILNGDPMDWRLIFRIATEVSQEEWEAGQAVVAARIVEIRRDFLTSVSPRLVQLDSGIWDVEKDAAIAQEPVEFAIAQVEIALSAALGAGQGNGLTETSGEAILIRSACSIHRSSPSVVATSFWNACMGLQKNIGNLYPEDATLIALQNTLFTSVEELCRQDNLIRDRVARLAALETRRMPTQDERKAIAEVPERLKGELTAQAQTELEHAVDIVVKTEKPPVIYRARLVNWLTILGRGIDHGQKNEKRAVWLLKLARTVGQWFLKDGDE